MEQLKRYQAFVSSTFEDLKEERFEVMHALLKLQCFPAGMELFPAASDDQWTHIKTVIDESDYYFVIVAGRYGSCDATGMSYTEREYHYAVSKAKPVVAFIHKHPESLPAYKVEQLLKDRQKLEAFKFQLRTRLCDFFDGPMDLSNRVLHAIVKLRTDSTAPGWVRGDRMQSLVDEVDSLTKQLAQQTKIPLHDSENLILAQTGPFRNHSASEIGDALRNGALAFFQHLNKTANGINGRHVELRSFNDYYDPEQSLKHVTQLSPDVFCFFGCVGTPTSQVIQPVITNNGIPFFAPFTGANFLRHDHSAASDKHYIVNVRSGYDEEVVALLDHVRERGIDRISCLYQDDAFGQGVLGILRDRLRLYGLSLAGEAGYTRNTDNVSEAFRRIQLARPQAIVLAGVYSPCATFIKLARDAGMDDCIFLCLSFVSSVALRKRLGKRYEENFLISEVVPFPWDDSIRLLYASIT